MKRFFGRLAVAAIAAAGIASWAYNMSVQAAQDTVNANAAIVAAIGITGNLDLDFASIVPDAVAQNVILDTASTITTCGAGAMVCLGTPVSASFDIIGGNNLTYTIDINGGGAAASLTGTGPAMNVDTWTSNPTPTGTLNGSGAQTVLIGATLHVGTLAAQTVGAYTATFTLDVAYN